MNAHQRRMRARQFDRELKRQFAAERAEERARWAAQEAFRDGPDGEQATIVQAVDVRPWGGEVLKRVLAELELDQVIRSFRAMPGVELVHRAVLSPPEASEILGYPMSSGRVIWTFIKNPTQAQRDQFKRMPQETTHEADPQ